MNIRPIMRPAAGPRAHAPFHAGPANRVPGGLIFLSVNIHAASSHIHPLNLPTRFREDPAHGYPGCHRSPAGRSCEETGWPRRAPESSEGVDRERSHRILHIVGGKAIPAYHRSAGGCRCETHDRPHRSRGVSRRTLQTETPGPPPIMALKWTSGAYSDLVRLHEFLNPVNPLAALRVARQLVAGAKRISYPLD